MPLILFIHYLHLPFHLECASVSNSVFPILLGFASFSMFLSLINSSPGKATIFKNGSPDNDRKHCKHCNLIVSFSSKHCHICGKCVDGFDHHCDVLEICIGSGNISLFRSFLAYHCLFCLYGVVVHTRMFICSYHAGNVYSFVSFLVLAVVEFGFWFAFFVFYSFMSCLRACNMTTYDFILKFRRLRKRFRDIPESCHTGGPEYLSSHEM